jgi:glyoxylase-like metal-dependent hydrolase (beta-lactamase superfamily II)
MATLELSEHNVLPLERVAPGVKGLRILFANVFGVTDGEGWTLVDGGLPASGPFIRKWADREFGGKPPRAIILTHGHFDHVGGVKDLLEHWNISVYAHRNELPYVTGRAEYPPPDPAAGEGILSWMAPLFPRGPFDLGGHVGPFPPDGSVPTAPVWTMIETPGHTPGHVSFFRKADRTLIVGDAFCTINQSSFLKVAEQAPELHGPPAYFTPDWDSAEASVRRLAELDPETAAPGHGPPMHGAEFTAALKRLAIDFDRLGRPKHGRYAHGST